MFGACASSGRCTALPFFCTAALAPRGRCDNRNRSARKQGLTEMRRGRAGPVACQKAKVQSGSMKMEPRPALDLGGFPKPMDSRRPLSA
jgi:hypothetical protein